MQPTERASCIIDPDNVQFVKWAKSNLHDGHSPRNHIWRSPVVAAMYATYHKCKKDAVEFWQRVRDETGASPSMPCRTLAKFLSTNEIGFAATQQDFRSFYVKSLHAWNAFRANKETDLKYYKDSKIPKVL